MRAVDNQITSLPPEQAISDDNLKAVIQDVFMRFFPLEANSLQVQVTGGRVTLQGKVAQLRLAQQITQEVQHLIGVREVNNRIEVRNERKSS